MILARVAGRITSTIHHASMAARKLLVCDKLDPAGRPTGGYGIATQALPADTGQGEAATPADEEVDEDMEEYYRRLQLDADTEDAR